MNISKNDIKILQEIEKIFLDLWQYKNEKTYKDNQDEAERIVIEGLKTASNAYPMLNEIAGLHGWINHHSDLKGASGQNALAELEMNYVGEDTEGIEHYRKFLIIELVEQKDWKSIIQYYALASDIHRWIDILKQESSQIPWSDDAEGYIPNSEAINLSDGRHNVKKLGKILKPDGPIRYMNKGRRTKVNVSDYVCYLDKLKKSNPDMFSEEVFDHFNAAEACKREIQEENKSK